MVSDAYFTKRILEMLKTRHRQYKWDKETKRWIKQKPTEQYIKKMDKIQQMMFDSYMTRIYMTVILNRNVKQNWLLRLLSGQSDEDQNREPLPSEETFKDKIRKVFAKQDGNNND